MLFGSVPDQLPNDIETSQLRVRSGAKLDVSVEISSDESDRELAALRNFPDGSINMLALGTHEGE